MEVSTVELNELNLVIKPDEVTDLPVIPTQKKITREPTPLFAYYYLLNPFSAAVKPILLIALSAVYDPIEYIKRICTICFRFFVAFELMVFSVKFIIWELQSPFIHWKLDFVYLLFGLRELMGLLKRIKPIQELARLQSSFLVRGGKKMQHPSSYILHNSKNRNRIEQDKDFKMLRAELLTAR
jgi:hypothetical protein